MKAQPWTGKRIAALLLSLLLAALGILAWLRRTGDARTFWLLGCGIALGLLYAIRGGSLPPFLANAAGITADDDPRNLPAKLYLPILLAVLIAAAIAVALFLRR